MNFVRHNLLYYTPNPGFAGNDSFMFTVTNNYGQALPAAVTANVTVRAVNYPPQSTSLEFTAVANSQGVSVTPVVNDPTAGDVFTYSVETQPTSGTVTVIGNQLIYTPNPSFTGLDSFLYRVTDSNGNTIMGVAQITVQASPFAATLGNISTRLLVETGDNVLIGGFIITGSQPKKVIVRAIGPSLPLGAKLENPTLELFGPNGLITFNDNWQEAANKQEIVDSTIPASSDLESAIVATLPANSTGYTAIVRGASNATGLVSSKCTTWIGRLIRNWRTFPAAASCRLEIT